MPLKDHPVLAKARRIARLRHKFRGSLRKRGWAKTVHLGWMKVCRRLSGDFSTPFLQWQRQKQNRLSGPAKTLHGGWKKVRRRLGWVSSDVYKNWIEENCPGFVALARQRRWATNTEGLPRIVLLITTAGCSQEHIARTERSLRRQTYPLWTLIHIESLPSTALLQEAAADPGFAYAGVVRGGDTLSPDALYEFARVVHEYDADRPALLYCDEDHLAPDGWTRSQPIFKPAWSPEMSLGYDYIGRLTLIRRDLMEQACGFDPGMGEAAEWDLKLRVASGCGRVVRITKCLYHNQGQADVRAVCRGAAEARAALQAHLARLGIAGGDAALQPNGTFRVYWPLPEYPLVSIVIPTVDKPLLIERCVRGLLDQTSYPNKEIILVDNGSTDAETLALYDRWKAVGGVKLVPFDRPFNYSAACNAGAAVARGQYLLFLNNDIEFVSTDWLEELMRWAQRPDVGVVGPKMIYPSGTINHAAGIAVTHGIYVNLYQEEVGDSWGIFGHVDSYKNTSGLLGACQLMSRSTYAKVGPYDERYLLVCSDIRICLEACRAGLRNIYTPYAVLIHDESTTRRGIGDPIDDLDLAAREVVRLAYFEDPYFHPSFKSCLRTPSLRPASELSSSEYFSWSLSGDNPGFLRQLELDLYDDAAVRDVAGRWSPGLGPRQWSPAKVCADPETAASFIIHLLRSDTSLRSSFPRALSGGPQGAFCQWLCSPEGLTRYGLPATAQTTICKAFEAKLAAKIRRVYELRPDLQRSYLLAYLPSGRARFFRWLISEGRNYYEFSDPAIWWFLIESAEDPDRELIRTYKVSKWWQRFFPDALTPLGWGRFANWLESRHGIAAQALDYRAHSGLGPLDELRLAYGCRGDWKRRFPKALHNLAALRELLCWMREHEGAEDPRVIDWLCRIEADIETTGFQRAGMNILGMFSYPSGHQESVTRYVCSLNAVGVVTPCRDVLYGLDRSDPNPNEFLDLELYDTTLVHLNPDLFPFGYEYARLAPRPGTYHIAMWAWETEAVPEDWKEISKQTDEVWATSTYVADSLRRVLDVPVHAIHMGFELGPIAKVDLATYGVPSGAFVFLFIFDMNSTIARKNPLGLMTAYKQAFQNGENASLIVKTSGGVTHCEDFYLLQKEAKKVGAIIVDERLPGAELNGLIAASDCYVSLHRSEGLGLTLAEAMMLGKPTIATGYSGNLDFMDQTNSLLIGYHLTEIQETAGPYEKGHRWAEPSIPEAARAMRWVFDHPDEARLLGERARLSAMHSFSPRECGTRMLDRLNQIRSERSRTRIDGGTSRESLQALELHFGGRSNLADSTARLVVKG
jgi:GT2 family glycosyltransferase/glycosyltransferase involved in cell wall biosynthesis